MKKRFFNLQMFADEAATETEATAAAEQGNPSDENKPETAAGADKGNEFKYSDADVDRIVARTIAKERERAEKQVAAEKAKASEAERLGKMTAEEKANERIKALEEKLAAADREKARAAMTKEARAILQGANIVVNDELLSNLVADDADTTKASVENFITLFNDAVEKRVKETYRGETPKKGGAPTLTKEQILAVQNRAERQRLISENIHLFK